MIRWLARLPVSVSPAISQDCRSVGVVDRLVLPVGRGPCVILAEDHRQRRFGAIWKSDPPRLWHRPIGPCVAIAALAVYFVMILASAWRWGLARRGRVPARTLTGSSPPSANFCRAALRRRGSHRGYRQAARSRDVAATVVLMIAAWACWVVAARRSGRDYCRRRRHPWPCAGGPAPAPRGRRWRRPYAAGATSPRKLLEPSSGSIRVVSETRSLLDEPRTKESPVALAASGGAVAVKFLSSALCGRPSHRPEISPWHLAAVVPGPSLDRSLSLNGFA